MGLIETFFTAPLIWGSPTDMNAEFSSNVPPAFPHFPPGYSTPAMNMVLHQFKVGDKVWTMENNKPVEKTVESLKILIHNSGTKILVTCVIISNVVEKTRVEHNESCLFRTKADLLASL